MSSFEELELLAIKEHLISLSDLIQKSAELGAELSKRLMETNDNMAEMLKQHVVLSERVAELEKEVSYGRSKKEHH